MNKSLSLRFLHPRNSRYIVFHETPASAGLQPGDVVEVRRILRVLHSQSAPAAASARGGLAALGEDGQQGGEGGEKEGQGQQQLETRTKHTKSKYRKGGKKERRGR